MLFPLFVYPKTNEKNFSYFCPDSGIFPGRRNWGTTLIRMSFPSGTLAEVRKLHSHAVLRFQLFKGKHRSS